MIELSKHVFEPLRRDENSVLYGRRGEEDSSRVMLNLVMNAIEAMNGIAEGSRELHVSSQKMTENRFDPGTETATACEVNE